jgi:predicted ATPase
MRVAVCGTHASGKSTLVAELRHLLPQYVTLEEPYYGLLEEGQVFGDRLSVEDVEVQLDRSCSMLADEQGRDVIFDRAPADYLAYLAALEQPGSISSWLYRATEAMKRLDFLVYVPIERPDRIGVGGSELPRLRREVDANLRQMLIDDSWGIGADIVVVEGDVGRRAATVIAELALRNEAED